MNIDPADFNDALIRGLAHRMNNILSLFHGYLELLFERPDLDLATRNGLAEIRKGAAAASDLMDRTKFLARPSSVVWREIPMFDLLRVLRPVFEECLRKGSQLELDCPAELPPAWADTSRLRTLLTELVRNATEACPSRQGRVGITVRSHERNPAAVGAGNAVQPIAWLEIAVSDNGRGIAPEVAEKMFLPFFTTRGKRNAVGLGLPVALGLVHQLGGTLWSGREGNRTVFRVMIPSRTEPV